MPGIYVQTLGRQPPPGGAPGALGRGGKRHGTGPQAPMRAVKDQKKYTIIQLYKVYSIHYTVYCVKYAVYRGIKGTLVYSILVYRVLKYTVYWYNGTRVLMSRI